MHIERIWQHDSQYWHTISRSTPRHGYTLYTNPTLVGRYDPNHAGYFRLQTDREAVHAIQDIIAFYDALGLDSVAYVDHCATPPSLATLLAQHGFVARLEWGVTDLMVLGTFMPPAPDTRITVSQVTSPHDIHAWATIDGNIDPHSPADIMYALRREEVSHPDVCGYIATIDGVAAGRCLRFAKDGVCRIEAVFVAEAFRRRGVARQLVAHAIAESLAHNQIIYLFADHDYHAATLYHTLGMRSLVHHATVTHVRLHSGA